MNHYKFSSIRKNTSRKSILLLPDLAIFFIVKQTCFLISVRFHQFRAAESSVHLQEHQGHFPFRCEEGLASQLRSHAFPYQTEVLCHLVEREQLLYSAQFALFES